MKKLVLLSTILFYSALGAEADSLTNGFRFDPGFRAAFVELSSVVVYNFSDVVLDADLVRIPSAQFSTIGLRFGLMKMYSGFWGSGGESNPNDFYGDISSLLVRVTDAGRNTRVDLYLGYAVEHRPHYYPKSYKLAVGGMDVRFFLVPRILGILVRFTGTSQGFFFNIGFCIGYFR